MFEMPPFWNCPKCGTEKSFGVLLVLGAAYRRRCKVCRHTGEFDLPDIDKRVIYVDQFALSEMVKARTRAEYNSPLKDFWITLYTQMTRLVMTQQAIFPDSNVHQDESLLSKIYEPLRTLYESLNGEVSFEDDTTVARKHAVAFAKSWITGNGVPKLNFEVDDILHGCRNAWLSPLRISVKSDYSQFIDRIREGRETVATEMQRIFEGWKNDKDAFDTVANREMAAYGAAYIHGIADGPQRMLKAMASNDPAAVLDESLHEANVLRRILSGLFEKHGVPEQDQLKKVVEFFRWDGLCELPSNRISGHLYAAVARKAAAGQKKPPTRGLTNDVRVISTYAPYVDAMFIDNECAGLLAEEPLRSRLAFKARIFCLNSKDEFVAYLRSLEQQTDPIVLKRANQLYGV